MNPAALIEDARHWANALIHRESRGPGDTSNAIKRTARRHGLQFSELWALRYRPPKRIFADVYFRLRAAYEAECQRQLRLLEHELERTKAVAGPDNRAVVAAEALLGARAARAESAVAE